MTLPPDQIPFAQKGQPKIPAEHWDGVVAALRQVAQFLPGGEGGVNPVGHVVRDGQPNVGDVIDVWSDEKIPPYSLFGVVYSSDQNTAQPVKFKVDKIGANHPGSPLLLFTNDQYGIDGSGSARAVGTFSPARVRITGDTPTIGRWCGYDPDEHGVTASRTGLLCLALEDEDYAIVVRAFDSASLIGVVTEEVTAYDSATRTLGAGKIKIQVVGKDSDELVNALDPGTDQQAASDSSSDSGDWEVDVFNIQTSTFAVNATVKCSVTLGVGLVVDGSGGAGGDFAYCPFKINSIYIDPPQEFLSGGALLLGITPSDSSDSEGNKYCLIAVPFCLPSGSSS